MTFDKEQQVYRRWFFDSNGSTVEDVGKWDEGCNTLTLKSEKRGITGVVSNHLVDEDTWEFSVVSKDQQGKVYFAQVFFKLKLAVG